jgi:hypothetical protein
MSQSGTLQLDYARIAQEVLKVLQPTLQAMKEEIMADVHSNIKNFHKTMLENTLEINKDIAKAMAKIVTLENQISQVRNAQKAAPAPVPKQTPTTYANPKPVQNGQTKPSAAKQTKPPTKAKPTQNTTATIVRKPYPVSEREIIVTFHGAMDMEENENTADIALELANNAITNNKDITSGPFIGSRFSMNGNLILTTGFSFKAIDYEAYLTIIADSLKSIGTASARVSEKWTKFLIHKVPTRSSMAAIRYDIETFYPDIKLGQTPRWLTKPEQREGKQASTIVIAVIGSVTKKQLGISKLQIRNRMCQLSEYYPHGPWTQCTKCQKYGHPNQLCKEEKATCAVCADSHYTSEHPCKFETCNAGPNCTHPPIKCINCAAPHKATDPNCPEKVKKSPLLKYGIISEQDDQVEQEKATVVNNSAGMQMDY